MERYEIRNVTNLTDTDHAGRIEAFLQAQGIATQGVSVGTKDGQRIVWVTADRDPGKALEGYVPTLTAEETERAELLADAQAAIAEIRTKPRNARTPNERVLLALAATEPVLAPSTPEEPIDP